MSLRRLGWRFTAFSVPAVPMADWARVPGDLRTRATWRKPGVMAAIAAMLPEKQQPSVSVTRGRIRHGGGSRAFDAFDLLAKLLSPPRFLESLHPRLVRTFGHLIVTSKRATVGLVMQITGSLARRESRSRRATPPRRAPRRVQVVSTFPSRLCISDFGPFPSSESDDVQGFHV
jgi:hypothetical protein